MYVGRSSPLATIPALSSDRDTLLPLLRWLILSAALGLSILALGRATAVGAQSPANCIPINQTSCLSNGVIYTNGTATANIGLPNVNVLPGSAYPYFGYGAYIAPNIFPAYYSGYNFYSENYGYLGTNCDPKAWWCLNYEYTGNVFAPLFAPGGNAATINTPASTPGGAATPAAPYHAAEVAQPAATVKTAAPVAAPHALAAPPAQTARALSALAPAQVSVAPAAGADVKVMSVQSATAPTVGNDGRDDGK